jgi:methylthioribose-1-phosphate isomerase
MSSAAAQSLDGALVALVAVSVGEATPRARQPVDQVEEAANSEDLQLALVASEPVAEASVEASADEVEDVAASAVDSEVIEEALADEVDSAEAADEVTLVVVAEVSATSPTAMDLPMALQLVLAVPEVVALAAIEEAEVDLEATEVGVEDDTKTDAVAAVVVVVLTEDPAALTTNRSAAEIDIATATVGTVVEAVTTAQGSAATKATATTIPDSAADTRPARWLQCLLQGFVKGYLPFLRLALSRH